MSISDAKRVFEVAQVKLCLNVSEAVICVDGEICDLFGSCIGTCLCIGGEGFAKVEKIIMERACVIGEFFALTWRR